MNALDSLTARREPIVALVTEDLDWNGRVIVPAGTEAFGYALPSPILDSRGSGRLIDSGEWTLVIPSGESAGNGRELALKARAVDRSEWLTTSTGRPQSWGPDDGVDGLTGYSLTSLDDRELKLFAAAAISGFVQEAAAVNARRETAPGLAGSLGATEIAPTAANAALGGAAAGASAAVNELVSRIREEINRRGSYVRVPAGKSFYLFVEQTIDPRAASVGLRLPEGSRPRER